jgi:hypothetical protein
MRLDFNVLWVDDQPDRIKAQIEAIERRMEAQGFLFKPTLCRSIDEVQQSVSNYIFTDEIDLILVDWDLGGGVDRARRHCHNSRCSPLQGRGLLLGNETCRGASGVGLGSAP